MPHLVNSDGLLFLSLLFLLACPLLFFLGFTPASTPTPTSIPEAPLAPAPPVTWAPTPAVALATAPAVP